MKKVLIFCRSYYPHISGGGEISTQALAENLVSLGYEVKVITISSSYCKEVINNVFVERLKFKNIYWSYESSNSLIKKIIWHTIDANNIFIASILDEIIKKYNPDTVVSSTIEDISSILWKISKKNNCKVIHILRSYSLLCTNANMFKNNSNCLNRCLNCSLITLNKKFNSYYVDHVVGISNFILNKHLQFGYFKNAQNSVIHNICFDEEVEREKSPSNEFKIGYLGRIHPTKGIDMILESMQKLNDKNNLLFIAGKGDSEYIKYLHQNYSNIQSNFFFSGLQNAFEFIDGIDLLIVPSKWEEPFGRVVIEALSRNVPVAVKRVGGMPELLIDNEDFIFDDISGLVKIISDYKNNIIQFSFNLNSFRKDYIMKKWIDII
ncbi:glycosyltransferase [Acinetobacter wanghuae]|uniref:Glycosyltransferase n=1 Tax=Acinetobacter wanghuae TaxID=2662362 RepID=A0A5Q0P9A0_9GAMM|nr:glycosyltransferase [Acinetobacter wanghuae]MQW92630.1 glycosyltransferase [Acinetobacter wanghuae]QGA12188.1 glycosyltransferase [Acinetobacter wanghuae]